MEHYKKHWAAIALAMASTQAMALETHVGDTTLGIYGYARLNMAYNFDGVGSSTSANQGIFGDIDGANAGDVFQASGTQSRIGFSTSTPFGSSTIDTVIEADFWSYGDSNPRARFRHGYGAWNGILAGQTTSNYGTSIAFSPTLDFFGTAGSNGFGSRLAQLRYTTGNISVAVEDPQSRLAENIDGSIPPGATLPDNDDAMSSLPAISLRYEDGSGPFSYSIAGIARQLKYNTGSEKDTEMGYATFIAGAYNSGPLTIRGIAHTSEGANSYLYLSGDLFNGADAYVNQDGALETLSGSGASAGLSYQITPVHSVDASYGFTDVESDNPQIVGGNAVRKNQNAFINLMWTPHERLMYGIEYGYFQTEIASGKEDASRLMVAAQYSF